MRSVFNINKDRIKLYFNLHFWFTCDVNDQNLLQDKIKIAGRSREEKLLTECIWLQHKRNFNIIFTDDEIKIKRECKRKWVMKVREPHWLVSTIAVSSLYPSIPSAIPGQDIQISLRPIGSRPCHFGRIPMYWNSL